jgi:hypothetical protein
MTFAMGFKMMSTAAKAPRVALAPRCVSKGRN